MTESAIEQVVFQVLKHIAPATEPAQLQPDDDIRQSLDMDSSDVLRFIVELDEKLGFETPQEDFKKLTTMRGLVKYFSEKNKSGDVVH
jgi:acyl carrier protein